MRTRSTVLFVLSDDTYVRNYVSSGALSGLTKVFDVDILIDSRVSLRETLPAVGELVGEFRISDSQATLHHLHFQLLMWRYRKKSRTFFYRWLRNTNWSLVVRNGNLTVRLWSLSRWLFAAVANPNGFRIPLMANALIFPIASRWVRKKIEPNAKLREILSRKRYAAMIFPSSAFEPASVDLVHIGRELGVPTICLIDNWDNLTSKTVFWAKPDHLGVWGQQAYEQSIIIHGFDSARVHKIGTPRFEEYFYSPATQEHPTQYPFPYILFVGSAMPFDEIGALRAIDEWLVNGTEFERDLTVIYRPHPWQQKRSVSSVFEPSEFSRVMLDTQISEALEQGQELTSRSSAFQPELSYYPDLLRGSLGVVGPLTTMLLEASICGRPTVGLSFFDGYHANTSKRYFSHFEGMENVSGFTFCESREELIPQLHQALLKGGASHEQSLAETEYFVTNSPKTFSHRLVNLVRGIVGDLADNSTKASRLSP